MAEYKKELVGATHIDISGRDVRVAIYRNKNGNLEILPEDDTHSWTSEWYNEELVIMQYKG